MLAKPKAPEALSKWVTWYTIGTLTVLIASSALARPPIRSNFFDAYPSAVGSRLDDLPSASHHCGVCHYAFGGGGPRNPYGQAVEATPDRNAAQILALGPLDSDGDGYTNDQEITDLVNFTNTPTFPGLTPANVGSVSEVDLNDIQMYLVPSTGADMTPPSVTVIAPNGGEMPVGNQPFTIMWTASDADSGVASIDIFESVDDGATFRPVALGLANTGSHTWYVPNRPSSQAEIKIVAIDNAFNTGEDESDAHFTVVDPMSGLAPTTLRDFDMPGTQPFGGGTVTDPSSCAVCHGNYDTTIEPYYIWQGSMMAQASIDPLFEACMTIANQDAPDSGDLCLRCHITKGWLRGRSVPTDGSQMLSTDMIGVSCDFCHRMVDPFFAPENPPEDQPILADLDAVPVVFSNGQYVVDPTGARRGPFTNADLGHSVLVSPFHREAALCGTCHDVSNPALVPDGMGNYVPNTFDAPATDFASSATMPIERTYSEWFFSDYNTLAGVFAPEFAGNKADGIVHTCQDCHMRDVNGVACNLVGAPIRPDMPLHDMTGGSTWLPTVLDQLHPGVNTAALADGADRARYMLQNAADMMLTQSGQTLTVRVINNCGHKLPTGYPEGRHIWLNVQFFDDSMTLVGESGAYDPNSGVLADDPELKVYHVEPGVDATIAPLIDPNQPIGPSFHFVLNNKIFLDNRIPPVGFVNADYATFGGTPIGATYADGQNWDDTDYAIPPTATSAQVTLYYQSTSKEYIEFLRDENTTNSIGQTLFDLWDNNGKSPPELMAQDSISLAAIPCGDFDNDGDVDTEDFTTFAQCFGGSGNPPAPTCPAGVDADCDDDGDVDVLDFVIFGQNYTGAH